jgi:hypothetical protein
MIVIDFEPRVFDKETLSELDDDRYSIMLGMFGNDFVKHYINNARPDPAFERRIKNLYTGEDINGNKIYYLKENILPEEYYNFLDYNKMRLIDILGGREFTRKFSFPITISMIEYWIKDIEYGYTPEFLQYLEDNPNEIFLNLMADIITDYFLQSKETRSGLLDLWTYVHYQFGYHKYKHDEDDEFVCFDILNHIKIYPEDIGNTVGLLKDKLIFMLLKLNRQLMIIMERIIDDLRELFFEVPLYHRFRRITDNNPYLEDIRMDLEDEIIKMCLDNFIYFYDTNNTREDYSEYLIFTPVFYYEKDNRFRTKDELYNTLIRGIRK